MSERLRAPCLSCGGSLSGKFSPSLPPLLSTPPPFSPPPSLYSPPLLSYPLPSLPCLGGDARKRTTATQDVKGSGREGWRVCGNRVIEYYSTVLLELIPCWYRKAQHAVPVQYLPPYLLVSSGRLGSSGGCIFSFQARDRLRYDG